MSYLSEKAAEGVTIDKKLYRMNTDFRVWLRAQELLGSGELNADKMVKLLKLCYIDLPPRLDKAIEGISEFFTMGEAGGEKSAARRAVIDFEADAKYIWAAFMTEYRIDLHTNNMHWHDFLTLLGGLPENNLLCKIIQYRSVNLSKIKNKEQRAFYRKMQKKYALPDRRSEEEKEAALAAAFGW